MATKAPYKETLLHWLWQNRCLEQQHLATRTGRKVVIHHPGYLNPTDGPDFTNARITIGELMWHGDIEIHWRSRDWYNHEHHTDENYNGVILHVVYYDRQVMCVQRQDQTTIPTLYIRPFLKKPLQYFFRHFRQPDSIPCAGNIADIPTAVTDRQFARAHAEYFEQKVNDLLYFYDPDLPLSTAWKKLLAIALFDGLGISHNRDPMQKLCRRLLKQWTRASPPSPRAATRQALRIAGIEPVDESAPFRWKRKGSRPPNHPENRIRQGVQLLWFIQNTSLNWWLRTEAEISYTKMLRESESAPGIGPHRAGILLGTVWLPALYILGDLTATKRLISEAKKCWSYHRTRLPASISRPFEKARFPAGSYRDKLGAVHQFRSYCTPHRCQDCEVFKHIISS